MAAKNIPELVKFEYDALMEEYRLCNSRAESINEGEKGFELVTVAIGAVVVAGSFAVTNHAYSILLLLALPFYVLIWIQLRRAIVIHRLVLYTTNVIAPRLNAIIQYSSEEYKKLYGAPIQFISWEEYVTRQWKNPYANFTAILPHLGRVVLQLLIAITLFVAYFLFVANNQPYLHTYFDWGLLTLNIVAGFVSCISFVTVIPVLSSKA